MSINLQQLLRYAPFFVGFIVAYYYKKRYDEKKIDDLYLYVVILGLIGARLTYAIFNVGLFKYDWSNVISISHYNLNVFGGLVISLIALYLLCSKHKLDIQKYLKYYTIILFTIFLFGSFAEIYLIQQFPFYLSMTSMAEIWLSIVLFSIGILAEILIFKKYQMKYHSFILIGSVFILKEFAGLL